MIKKIGTGIAVLSLLASTNVLADSTENQLGRDYNIDSGTATVDTRFTSYNFPEKNLRSLKTFKDKFSKQVGHLSFYGNNLSNVNEMFVIEYIDGNVSLHGNPLLNIDGMQNVVIINGSFYLYNNKLEDLDGMLNVERVNGDLIIAKSAFRKDGQINTRGTHNLEYVGEDFQFSGIKMASLETKKLRRVEGYFDLKNNNLKDLSGASNLRYANSVNLKGNPLIDISAIHNLEVEGYILIDEEVVNNPNFRGMRASAKLCKPENAKHFHPDGASQKQLCEKY